MKLKQYKHRKKQKMILLVSLVAITLFIVGGTIAFLTAKTDVANNTFIAGKVSTSVDEIFEKNIKSNVSIKNTGNVMAYIRAAVVVTWQDAEGNVAPVTPVAGTDYKINYNLAADGWVKSSDGFYYWVEPVKSVVEDEDNCNTGVLITNCSPVEDTAPDGYSLCVEILGSGIQSLPTSVVTDEWSSGVSGVDGTTLDIKQ